MLVKIQQKLKVPKNQLNKFGGYKYRNAEDILDAVKGVLAELKIDGYITCTDDIIQIGERYYVRATAMLNIGDKVFKTIGFAREEENKKGMDGSQITGAASSYARKYALNGLFAIDDTKDSDHTNKHETPAQKRTMQNPTFQKDLTENQSLHRLAEWKSKVDEINNLPHLINFIKKHNKEFKAGLTQDDYNSFVKYCGQHQKKINTEK